MDYYHPYFLYEGIGTEWYWWLVQNQSITVWQSLNLNTGLPGPKGHGFSKYAMIENQGIGLQPESKCIFHFDTVPFFECWSLPTFDWMRPRSNIFISPILETWSSRHRRTKICVCCHWTYLYSCLSFSLRPTISWDPASLPSLCASLLLRHLNGGVFFKSDMCPLVSISTPTQVAKNLIEVDTSCRFPVIKKFDEISQT